MEFAFNIYDEAGTGFANDLRRRFSLAWLKGGGEINS